MKVFLAGDCYKSYIIPMVHAATVEKREQLMEAFLQEPLLQIDKNICKSDICAHKPCVLESFYYNRDSNLTQYYGGYMLDSGAYTFMQKSKHGVKWEEYVESYAQFIKQSNTELFFELDIDAIVGYDKVVQFRKQIEKIANKQPIPVWHNNRGLKEFERMAAEYPYVAIGGLVGGNTEYSRKYWKYFPWFIQTAHKNNAKIHALGFTSLDGIKRYHFDSVDSTAWTSGNRFGGVFLFNGKTIQRIETPAGKKMKVPRRNAIINYVEWLKFQKYAEGNL